MSKFTTDQLRDLTLYGDDFASKIANQCFEAEQTAEKLRKGIQDFLDGEYHHPRSCRPQPCEHDNYWWEDCNQCDEAHFMKVLDVINKS